MTRRSSFCIALLCGLLLSSVAAFAADWPQYRGPNRHGTTTEAGLLESWSEAGPREVWRREIGDGFSAVTAVGDRLYTMAIVEGQESVLSLDAATGKTLWSTPLGEPIASEFGDGPRATPTYADGRLYTATSNARFVALDAKTGKILWSHELANEELPAPRFGYSPSPLVDGEVVIQEVPGKEGESVVAYDRKSGEVRWKALDGPAGYSSPIVAEIAGVRQYVFSRRVGQELVALSTGGEVLWRHPMTDALTAIPMPVFVPPDQIFVATSDDAFGGLMIRVTKNEEGFSTESMWSERLMRNHFNTSVHVGGYLYGFDNATFKCLDAETGERQWSRRGFGKGSLIAAGDLLYVLGDAGQLALVRATPEAYEELGRVKAMTGKAWTSPSLADGRLYLRDFDEIVSYDVRAAGQSKAADGAGPVDATDQAKGDS